MTDDLCILKGRIGSLQNPDKLCKALILDGLIGRIICAFELYTDRKIVALLATTVKRLPSMPGALVEWDVLRRLTVARDQNVA